MLSISTVAAVLLVVLAAYKFVVYPLFISPLSRIPSAHPTSSVSPLWILWIRQQHRENEILFAAHKKHGPVVRLSPDEVSVNSYDGGLKTIYGRGFEKSEFYHNSFANYGVHNMFSTMASAPHSARKRMVSNAYSKSTIQSSPTWQAASSLIIRNRFFPLISSAKGEPVDAHNLFQRAAMDLVTSYMFGLRSASNFLENPKEARWWLDLYTSRRLHTFWYAELPVVSSFMSSFGIHLTPPWVDAANRDLADWSLLLCDRAEAILSDDDTKPEDIPAIYGPEHAALLREASKPPSAAQIGAGAPLRLRVASDMFDQLAAGHETSSITLTFLFHELSLRPTLQARLRDESRTLGPAILTTSTTPLPPPASLDALPLLHAVLMETLRAHAAIPGPQPRVAPPGGTRLGPDDGYVVPAGTRVSCSAHCLHRLPEVYADPEVWRYDRWSDPADTDEATRNMHRHFWAFGSGGRMCIGSNLAMAQMKLVAAAVVANWRVEPDRIVDEQGKQVDVLTQEDAYTAQPEEKAMMRFVPW